MTYCRGAGGDLGDDRRRRVREDRGERRKVAGAIVPDREEISDGLLALGDAAELAHGGGDYGVTRVRMKGRPTPLALTPLHA